MSTIDSLLLATAGAAEEAAAADKPDGDKRQPVPPPSQFVQNLLKSLVLATKASNAIPTVDNDYDYHVSSNTVFKSRADAAAKRSLSLIDKVVHKLGKSINLTRAENLTEPDSFDAITDVLDTLLESADIFIDVFTGNDTHKQVMLMKGQLQPVPWTSREAKSVILDTANDMPKPQMKFAQKVDNSRAPFVPSLTSKPNAVTPLQLVPIEAEEEEEDNNGESHITGYVHPYEAELSRLEFVEWQLRPSDKPPQLPPPVTKDTTCTWVDTVQALDSLVKTLKKEKIVAVDLENHSYRSFCGFVCLMQISTRSEDYLVDTLALRAQLEKLNIVFTDPAIVKVLHGSDHDILWLQRDFGLYIVNMFDTGQAARVLDYPGFSLAYLLRLHCKHVADKKYQLADWRIRPLTEEMKKYAQEDTHYLLYLYDLMKNELLSRSKSHNLLLEVLRKSKELCLQRYEKPLFTPNAYVGAIETLNLLLTPQQSNVFAALFEWRDRVGREQDESVGYVLPKHVLIKLTKGMPTTLSALNRCCNPLPPLVRELSSSVLELIIGAKNQEVTERVPPTSLSTPSTSSEFVTPKHRQASDLQFSATDNTPSPITSYAKLYTVSGWTPNTIRRQAALVSPLNDNFSASEPLSGVDFSESSGANGTVDPTARKADLVREQIAALPIHMLSAKNLGDLSWQSESEAQSNSAKAASMAEKEAQESSSLKPSEGNNADTIPQSIADIYHMSNVNRKRKKEKRKLKETAVDASNGQDDDDDEYAVASKMQKTDIEDAGTFMNKLGWVKPEESQPLAASSDPAPREKAKFKPFDYAAAASATTGYTIPSTTLLGRKQGEGQETLNPHVAAAYGVRSGHEDKGTKTTKAVRRKGNSKSSHSRGDWPAKK